MQLQRSDEKLWKMYFKQQKDMEQLQEQNNVLQQQIQDQQTEIRNLQEQKAVFEQNYENLYNIYIDKDYALKQLVNGRIDTENKRIKELQQQMTQQNARIDELLKEKAAYQMKLDKELHEHTVQYQDQIDQYIIQINELRHQMTHIQTEADATRTKLMLEYNQPGKLGYIEIQDSHLDSFDVKQLTDLLIKVINKKSQKEKQGQDCSSFNQVLKQLARIDNNQFSTAHIEQIASIVSNSIQNLNQQLVNSMNIQYQKLNTLKQKMLILEQKSNQQGKIYSHESSLQKRSNNINNVINENIQNEDISDVISMAKKQIIEQNHILDAVTSDPQFTQIDILSSTVQHNPSGKAQKNNLENRTHELDLNKCQKNIQLMKTEDKQSLSNENNSPSCDYKEVVESSLIDTQTLGVKRAVLPINTPTFVVGQSGVQHVTGPATLQLTAKRDKTVSKSEVAIQNVDNVEQKKDDENIPETKQKKSHSRQKGEKLRDAFGNSINSTKSDILLDQFGNQLLSDVEEQQHLHDKYGNSLYSDSDYPDQFNYF